MDASIRQLLALSTRQHGLVTRAQLLSIGRTSRQIDHALVTGSLIRMHQALYRVAGAALSVDGHLAAGLMLTGGVASHRSAAHLLDLTEEPPSAAEITVGPTQTYRDSGLIVHRSSDLLPSDIIRIRGLRCTNATRTLIDLGAVVSYVILEGTLERALYRRLTTVRRLQQRLEGVARRGRPGTAKLRRLLDLRSPRMAATESELELLLWQALRNRGVPLPERQVIVKLGGTSYRLDLAYRPEKIFIEGDGFGVHSTRSAFEADRTRQNQLVLAGWLPLRFTWQQARQRGDEVAAQVLAALAMRRDGSRSV